MASGFASMIWYEAIPVVDFAECLTIGQIETIRLDAVSVQLSFMNSRMPRRHHCLP